MRKCIGEAWLVWASSAAWLLASGTALAADQTIDEFEAVQQAAWNAHDAGAYTARFDTTAEIVTSLGWHWRGQAEAARNLGDGFKLVYAQARLRVSDVQARMLTPELASVTLRWTIDGARTIDGGRMAGAQAGFETQLLQRHGEGWIVLAQQDTVAVPMPAAPVPVSAVAPIPASPGEFPMTPPPVRRCIVARANGDCLLYGKAKKNPIP